MSVRPGPSDSVVATDICTLATVRRVAAMLDLDPDRLAEGQPLPRGWHFILLGCETRRSAIRADGFPGFGLPLPDLGLPRLLAAGRTVEVHADIPIGGPVERTSAIESIDRKAGTSGPVAIVSVRHELRPAPGSPPSVVERQTFIMLDGRPAVAVSPTSMQPATAGDFSKTVVSDETLLFQFSALGFNSHRIHLDRGYAREVEGHPDLVVNGGLTTLLLTELLRTEGRHSPRRYRVRFTAPLYCHRPLTLSATREGDGWRLRAFDDRHTLAADMEAEAS